MATCKPLYSTLSTLYWTDLALAVYNAYSVQKIRLIELIYYTHWLHNRQIDQATSMNMNFICDYYKDHQLYYNTIKNVCCYAVLCHYL